MKNEEPIKLVFLGNPLNFARYRGNRHAIWDEYSQAALVVEMALKSQYGERSPMGGPLHLEATFFIRPGEKNMSRIGRYHQEPPELRGLLEFVERQLMGIVYISGRDLSCVSARKQYDTVARTEVIVRRL